ncbi:MAG TPA: site-2 protease family protein [Ruminococcaceae bacterium]|nr:site-2 protease family protein [Oscillospiraceae bacterium]
MAHIDPIGALMIFLVGFGYAKPVPVNMRNFRRKRKDGAADNVYYMGSDLTCDSKYAKKCMALVALAGPVSNLLMAIVSLLFMNVIKYLIPLTTITAVLYYFFYYCASVNVALALFNFVPIPPLDGSRILNVALPDKVYYSLMKYERYIMLGIFILILTGALNTPLAWLQNVVIGGLDAIVSLPFKLF